MLALLLSGVFATSATEAAAQEVWNWDMVVRGTGGAVSPTLSSDVWIPPNASQSLIIDSLFAPIDAAENPVSHELLITDSYNSRVLRFDNVTGAYKGQIGTGTMSYPYGLAIDASGNVMVTDWATSQILAFDQNSAPLADIPWNFGATQAGFFQPWAIAFTPGSSIADGNQNSRIIVVDSGNNRILTFGTDGRLINSFGSYGSNSLGDPVHGQFDLPLDIWVRPVSGTDPTTGAAYAYSYQLYIADWGNTRIQVFTPTGTWLSEIGGLALEQGVAVDANGRVLVADTLRNRIAVYSPYPAFAPLNVQIGYASLGLEQTPIQCNPGADGTNPDDPRVFAQIPGTTIIDPNQCAPGALQAPTNISLDSSGRLIVIDSANGRVERFNHPPMTVTVSAINPSVAAGSPITLHIVAAAASGSFPNVNATLTITCRDSASVAINCASVLTGAPVITPASGTVTQGTPFTFTAAFQTQNGVFDKGVTFVATVTSGVVTASSLPSDPVRIGFTGVGLVTTAQFTPALPSTGWWITTPPVIKLTATGTPAPDEIDWALTGDAVNAPAPDAVQVCAGAGPCAISVTGETALTLWYRAKNSLQNEPWHTSPLNFEINQPVITAVSQSATPCATCAGWVNTDVVTTYAISNSISGIKTITPAPVVLNNQTVFQLTASGEGSAVASPTLTVVDNAGLQNTAVYTFKIDKTKPTISATTTRTAATNGIWNRGPVTVTFTATDPRPAGVNLQSGFPLSLSGSATPFIGDPAGKFVTTVITEGANQSVIAGPATFIDLAGNTASNSVTVSNINIDLTAPVITPTFSKTLPASGWFNSTTTLPIQLTFIATDALSGVSGTATQAVTVNAQGTLNFTSQTFTDVAGNTATTTITVKVDTVLPTLQTPAIVGPGGLVTNALGFFDLTGLPGTTGVTVNLTAADATSGIQSVCYDLSGGSTCTQATAVGSVYSLTVLATTTTARAWVVDNAGNQSAFQTFAVKITRSTPAAVGNNLSTQQNQPLSGVLTSTATPGSALTYTVTTQPAHGTIVVTAATGAFTYTPASNYSGTDSFKFTVSDGAGVSQPAPINISIGAVNQAPVATAGSATTTENHAVTIAVIPGLVTDSDTATSALSFAVVQAPAKGTVSISGGSFVYTPNTSANGTDTFTYRAYDGALYSTATPAITVTITAVNDAPSFVKGANVTSNEDAPAQTVVGWATGISAGPADEVSSQAVNFIVSNSNSPLFTVQPAVSATGTLTYTSAPNVSGTATVTVLLHDNGGTANGGVDTSAAQTFTITINPVNDVPSFTPGASQTVSLNSGAKSVAWATGISAGVNESTQVLNFIVSNSNATLFSAQPAIAANGTLTFTPATGASGTATVTVQLHDDGGTTNGGVDTTAPVTFTITVTAGNRPPVAVADTATTPVKTSVTIDVLANDSDPDGNALSLKSVSSCSRGGTAVIVGGTVKFTPSSSLVRGDVETFTYTVIDTKGSTATGTVTVTISNSAPLAVNDSASTRKGDAVVINVLSNDFDADRDKLTITATTAPAHGTRTVNSNGTISYTPAPGYEGTDSFTYTVSDGKGGTATGTVVITIIKHTDGDGCAHDQRGNTRHDDDDCDHDRDTKRGDRSRGW